MSKKEEELIAVAASVAAGCEPCTQHHVKAARKAGSEDGELSQMVETALSVRNRASQRMAAVAWQELGVTAEFPCCASTMPAQKVEALAAAAAALAANCGVGVPAFLAAARDAGATEREGAIALGIARQIKKVAAEKAEEAWGETAGEDKPCCFEAVVAESESNRACC